MANRNSKLIERILKDFSLNISTDGEGGTKVVTELPETGEEHTIYELQEKSKDAYDWVAYNSEDFRFPPFVRRRGLKLFVFDTYKQMEDTLAPIILESYPDNLIAYTRLDDMLYQCDFKDGWNFESFNRRDDLHEHYVFAIPDGELDETQYILKSFDGYDEEGHGLATLPDDTKVTLYDDTGVFVLRQAAFDIMSAEHGISEGSIPNVSELPVVEDGDITNGVILNGSAVVNFNGKTKYSLDATENYYFDYDDWSFRKTGVWEDKGPLYTGELEWTEEIPEKVKEYLFEEYPYESIIDGSIFDEEDYWLFQPKKGGEITSSYWIYANDEWVNVDDIPDPNTIKVGITCSNHNWNVRTLPLNTITVTYDDVDYKVIQYAETVYQGEDVNTTTYYGYIEVPMPTQDNLTHTFKVSTTEDPTNWAYLTLISGGDTLNSERSHEVQGIFAIEIYYENNA